MNIAILGIGTIGFGVYDIITRRCNDIFVKKVFEKDLTKRNLVGDIITSNLDEILNDESIETVVETMGGLDFSFECIKKCFLHNKNVVTANKEVISVYLDELTKLKGKNKLLFEGSVGGGVPIINNMIEILKTNKVYSVEGIMNGTTNYILTKMNEGMDFEGALELAQKNGFAESNPTNDLEGLDMVRKIAILTMLCTNKKVDIKEIYHYGISNIKKEDVDFLKENNYSLKLMATYRDNYIGVEPHGVNSNNMFYTVNDEYNMISFNCENYDYLKFYGKGAGRYPTANAIISDLHKLKNEDIDYSFSCKGKYEIEKDLGLYTYYIRLKDNEIFNKQKIERKDGNKIITKPMPKGELDLEKIAFYAILD